MIYPLEKTFDKKIKHCGRLIYTSFFYRHLCLCKYILNSVNLYQPLLSSLRRPRLYIIIICAEKIFLKLFKRQCFFIGTHFISTDNRTLCISVILFKKSQVNF